MIEDGSVLWRHEDSMAEVQECERVIPTLTLPRSARSIHLVLVVDNLHHATPF